MDEKTQAILEQFEYAWSGGTEEHYSDFVLFLTINTTEDELDDAIEHYAIGGSPIDYTPEDEK